MQIKAHIIGQGEVQVDLDCLLKWSKTVNGLLIADRIFKQGDRGTIPEEWSLSARLKDDRQYVVMPTTELERADLEMIACFHWLRPDLVQKLPKWPSVEVNQAISKSVVVSGRDGKESLGDKLRAIHDKLSHDQNRVSKPPDSFEFKVATFQSPQLTSPQDPNPRVLKWKQSFLGVIITGCERDATIVKIPSSIDGKPVTAIGDEAFMRCESLTFVDIPHSVNSIGDRAFQWCTSLISVCISRHVTRIGDGAFQDCESLTSIRIPDSVTFIGNEAFRRCESLTSVRIPDGVTSIGFRTFARCDSLISLYIPNSVSTICEEAFRTCESLSSVTIPSGVVSIGAYAFHGCDRLTSVFMPFIQPILGTGAFLGCPWQPLR